MQSTFPSRLQSVDREIYERSGKILRKIERFCGYVEREARNRSASLKSGIKIDFCKKTAAVLEIFEEVVYRGVFFVQRFLNYD